MDIITHTILAVGSLICFFYAGHYFGRREVTEDFAEHMVDQTLTMLERDGLIRVVTKDGEKEIVPISEVITEALRNVKV